MAKTKIKRKAGGQPGNQNSLGHGRPRLGKDTIHVGVRMDKEAWDAVGTMIKRTGAAKSVVIRAMLKVAIKSPKSVAELCK